MVSGSISTGAIDVLAVDGITCTSIVSFAGVTILPTPTPAHRVDVICIGETFGERTHSDVSIGSSLREQTGCAYH